MFIEKSLLYISHSALLSSTENRYQDREFCVSLSSCPHAPHVHVPPPLAWCTTGLEVVTFNDNVERLNTSQIHRDHTPLLNT